MSEDWTIFVCNSTQEHLRARPLPATFLWSLMNHREQSSGKSANISLQHTIICSSGLKKDYRLQLLLSLSFVTVYHYSQSIIAFTVCCVICWVFWHICNTFWWQEMVWNFSYVLYRKLSITEVLWKNERYNVHPTKAFNVVFSKTSLQLFVCKSFLVAFFFSMVTHFILHTIFNLNICKSKTEIKSYNVFTLQMHPSALWRI